MHNINEVKVTGHANYAPHGQDIVCASVSMLLQTVGYTLLEREDTNTLMDCDEPGLGMIVIQNPTRESHLITSVFEKGAFLLAADYPDYVQLEMK